MATHSSVLAWRIPGTGKPGGLPSMGSHRVGHDWSDLAAAAAAYTKKCTHIYTHINTRGALERCSLLEELGATHNKVSWIIHCVISFKFSSVQFISVTQSCPTLHNPMNRSTPGLTVHHHLPEFTQSHVRRVGDAIQPSHPRSSPSPPAPNPSQHQSFPVSQLFS